MIDLAYSQYLKTVNDKIKKIDKQIAEERKNTVVDKHKIMKLEEEKLINDMFNMQSNNYGIKFKNPW